MTSGSVMHKYPSLWIIKFWICIALSKTKSITLKEAAIKLIPACCFIIAFQDFLFLADLKEIHSLTAGFKHISFLLQHSKTQRGDRRAEGSDFRSRQDTQHSPLPPTALSWPLKHQENSWLQHLQPDLKTYLIISNFCQIQRASYVYT